MFRGRCGRDGKGGRLKVKTGGAIKREQGQTLWRIRKENTESISMAFVFTLFGKFTILRKMLFASKCENSIKALINGFTYSGSK